MSNEFTIPAYAHDAVWFDMVDRGYVEVSTEFSDKELEIQDE